VVANKQAAAVHERKLSKRIIAANPILEAFGNARWVDEAIAFAQCEQEHLDSQAERLGGSVRPVPHKQTHT